MKKVKVVLKKAFQKPEIISIPAKLESFQKCVGGWIEAVVPSEKLAERNIVAYVNEEGKLCGQTPNLWAFDRQDVLVGDVVFVGSDGEGGDESLTDEDIAAVLAYCEEMQVTPVEMFLYFANME